MTVNKTSINGVQVRDLQKTNVFEESCVAEESIVMDRSLYGKVLVHPNFAVQVEYADIKKLDGRSEKAIKAFIEEFAPTLNTKMPADFGDSIVPYVENPAARIFGQRIYHVAEQQQGAPGLAAAVAVGMAVASVVSAAAEVTQATSAAKMARGK